jgi:retinol-binding protein 3
MNLFVQRGMLYLFAHQGGNMKRIMIAGIVICFAVTLAGCGQTATEESQSVNKEILKSEAPVLTLDSIKRKEVIIDLAEKLISEYVFPETGAKMAEGLKAKLASNAYDNVTSPQEFAGILTQDLYAISHDKHLQVKFGNEPALWVNQSYAELVESIRKMNGGIVKVEILDHNVGYMRINQVWILEASRDAISAAFAFLHNTDALILDNRNNMGGDPQTVAWYMSYLSEGKPYIVNQIQLRKGNRLEKFKTTDLGKLSYGSEKPVFVLTSSTTGSGGEELTYDIQQFKRGLVVGAVTWGGANPVNLVQLAHQFKALIPYGYAINPVTGGNWEGIGVKPDVEVPPEQVLIEAQLLAVKRLLADEKDLLLAQRKFDALAMKLELQKTTAKGGESELKEAQILGKYTSNMSSDRPVTIIAKDGDLYQHLPPYADAKLIPAGGNRYKLEGLSEGYFVTFILKDGKIQMLGELPQGQGDTVLLEKQ